MRLSAVAGAAVLLAAIVCRPWTLGDACWRRVAEYEPSPRVVASALAIAGLVLFWIVLTLFQGGSINAIDFTVYFDRPLYQTIQGRPLHVETTDEPFYAHRTHLGVHAYWLTLGLAAFYAIHPSPLWLLTLSVVAVVIGARYVVRIGLHAGLGGTMSAAAALAFLLNDNTARTLRYGFHPEVLYAWFVPWLLDAGLRRARLEFMVAAVACVLVKEDALLPVGGAVAVLALLRWREMNGWERVFYLGQPIALAAVNLLAFYQFVVPVLSPSGGVVYATLWSGYAATPLQSAIALATQPFALLRDLATSGLMPVLLPPFLFLPLIGWRWFLGALPLVATFAIATDPQIRGFGLYYGIYTVPFLSLGAAAGALTLTRRFIRGPAHVAAAATVVVLAALVVGRGYALRPWRAEIAAVPQAIALLADAPVVLVQSSLYPHAGYDERVQLLTPAALDDPRNAGMPLVLAEGLPAFPFTGDEHHALLRRPALFPMPGGLVAVRNCNESNRPPGDVDASDEGPSKRALCSDLGGLGALTPAPSGVLARSD